MSLIRKAAVINTGALTGIVIGTVQTIILTRTLGPQGIGQYALIVAFLSLAATVSAFGVPLAYLFFVKQNPEASASFFTNAFFMLLFIGLVFGVAVAIFVRWRTVFFGSFAGYTIAAIGFYFLFALLRLLFRNHLMVNIAATKLSIIELLAASISLIFVFGAWGLRHLTVNTALLSFIVSAAVRCGLGWVWSRDQINPSLAPDNRYIRQLTQMGMRQMWPDLLVVLNDQVGILLLKLLIADFSNIGFYSRAVSLSALLIILCQAMMPVLFSRWASLSKNVIQKHVELALRFLTIFALSMAILFIVFAKWVILFFYGDAFIPAILPLQILSLGTALSIINRTLVQLFSGRGMPEMSSKALLFGVLTTGLLCLLLVPRLGIHGCAIAIVVGQIAVLMILFRLANQIFQLSAKRCLFIRCSDIRRILKSIYCFTARTF